MMEKVFCVSILVWVVSLLENVESILCDIVMFVIFMFVRVSSVGSLILLSIVVMDLGMFLCRVFVMCRVN